MYRKKTSSWLKHWDFILLDLILLELSYLLAHWLYFMGLHITEKQPLYRNVFCDSGDRSGCGTDDGKLQGHLKKRVLVGD